MIFRASRLEALTERRRALQAECAAQRDEVHAQYSGIQDRLGVVDRTLVVLRSLAPLLAVAGVAVVVAVGPRRAGQALQRGLPMLTYFWQARRLLGGV